MLSNYFSISALFFDLSAKSSKMYPHWKYSATQQPEIPTIPTKWSYLLLEVSENLYSVKSFYTMGLYFVIPSTMISLVGFLTPFAVWITIKAIPTFTIWNYYPLFFRILFCSILFLVMLQSHIFFYSLPNASETL